MAKGKFLLFPHPPHSFQGELSEPCPLPATAFLTWHSKAFTPSGPQTFFPALIIYVLQLINLFMGLQRDSVAARRLCLVVVSQGLFSICSVWASHCGGISCCLSVGSRHVGFSSCGTRLSCSAACGMFPDQGSNPCPLIGRWILNHWTTKECVCVC